MRLAEMAAAHRLILPHTLSWRATTPQYGTVCSIDRLEKQKRRGFLRAVAQSSERVA
jgi:hypothetical protein